MERHKPNLATTLQRAIAAHQAGQLAEAEQGYRQVLALQPNQFDALHYLGVIEAQRGNPSEAIDLIGQALKANPRSSSALFNIGNAQIAAGRYEEALVTYGRLLSLDPTLIDALHQQGHILSLLGRHEEALAVFDRVLAQRPDRPESMFGRANALHALRRHEEALVAYVRALALKPNFPEAICGRAVTLHDLQRHEEALAGFARALAIKPGLAEAHLGRANVLQSLQRHGEAIESYNLALAAKPDLAEAFYGRGYTLMTDRRFGDAQRDFEQVLRLAPHLDYARGNLLNCRMQRCDWSELDRTVPAIEADVRNGLRSIHPFTFIGVSNEPADLLACARIHATDRYPPASPLWKGERYGHRKIRLGYVCGEFRAQATSFLITGLYELHDRSCFELYAFDNGWDDGSDVRARIEESFDEMVPIAGRTDSQAARAIREREIDILIDLNGYFGAERTGVFALRPSPVQVNFLGFPASMGSAYIDYIIADRWVIPEDQREFFSEQVVYLPESYQPNDPKRAIAPDAPTRREAGLPEHAFVFCCFNNSYKITPAVFDIWVRLLQAVEGSVLWLLEGSDGVAENLRREAVQRGVAADRLVFASRAAPKEHLARHRLADLFLDTVPCNAHTTASDALWAGLPVLSLAGATFPGRVAASLLDAVGLPELIARSPEEYEAMALRLARDAEALRSLKSKLARNRLTYPLFDTDRFRHHIEAAYRVMWERAERGEPPEAFTVPSLYEKA